MKITWGKLKETNPELAEQVAFSIGDDSVEAVPFDDTEELDLDLSEVTEQKFPSSKEKLFRTLLNVIEDEDGDDINEDGFKFAPTTAENAEWFKKFGLNVKKTGQYDQSGPAYELTGPKEALQRLWTEYDAMSNPDFDPAKDYGIADEDNQWWADQIKEVDVNGDGDTDVTITDTNGNGKPDTAVVTADSEKEQKEAVKAAKDELDVDEQTSTGKTKKELDDQTISDMRQKNVLSALLDHRF